MKKIKVIMDRVEICQYDGSVFKGISSINIFTKVREFVEKNGWDNPEQYCYDVDYETFIGHIYAITYKEVEL